MWGLAVIEWKRKKAVRHNEYLECECVSGGCVCVWMCIYLYVHVCGYLLTAVGGAVLAVFPLFLRSSSLTGSLTLTPWYGLDAACSDSAMNKHKEKKEKSASLNETHLKLVV